MATCDLISDVSSLVDGDRQADYGDPVESMTNIGKAWSGILRTNVDAVQVALCLAAMKLVRFGYKSKADSIVDAVGYCEIAKRCDAAETDTELETACHAPTRGVHVEHLDIPSGFEVVEQRRQVERTATR